jgi:hypothetical protein
MELNLTARLIAVNYAACSEDVKKVIGNIDIFLEVLAQSYENLDGIRISKLQLIEFKQ